MGRAYGLTEAVVVVVGLIALVVSTIEDRSEQERAFCLDIVAAVAALAALDWLWHCFRSLRLARRSDHHWLWWRSRQSVIELLGFVPIACAAPFGWSPSSAPLLGIFWILRFARHSKGMDLLFMVLAREREAVLGVLFLFLAMLMICAVAGYFLEHDAQPSKFGSVPLAIWWTIATLTTTGYGDVIPVTVGGRVLAGVMMITGIVVFGLLAGILGTGFSQELRRQEFLRNWDLVKQVPIFSEIGPSIIADLAGLLRSREIPARTILWRRGEPGAAMYFIVSGSVDILVEPVRRLGAGDFFGEIALLGNRARTATAVTTRDTLVLMLDIADFRALAATRPELMRSIEVEAKRRMDENGAPGQL